MARGIDHIVHAVRDFDSAAALYRGLGFTVGAANIHPRAWATKNRIIQFPGVFIELLALTDADAAAPHAPRSFSFGAFNHDFLARGEGLSMLVLEGKGAADATDFRNRGIGDFDLYNFEREGKRPDGTPVKVAFSLAFARDAAAPDTGFFTCQQHYPKNFWNPAFQKHANSVTGVAGVVLVADEPARHRPFLLAFTGASEAVDADAGFVIVTPRGVVDVTTPAAFIKRYGVAAPGAAHGAWLAAVRFIAADASLPQSARELAGIAGLYAGNPTVIGADDAMGAVLVFEQATG